ncbi:hypothetical protein [Actinocrispum sp. NPDC049592]|uniref:hypothetical protein n=1 Tax=Actinocrispum sp. NPDC049592 TaxID=3154835 RepID=UPI00341586D7
MKYSASSSVASSQRRPSANRKFSHIPSDCAYFFHVNGERLNIRGDAKNAFTRPSGRPPGPIRNG